MEARVGDRVRAATRSKPSPVSPEARSEVGSALERVAEKFAGGDSFARLLTARLDAAAGDAERERTVLDAILPPHEVLALANAATVQLFWNARARGEAVAEFGALTAARIAELRGVETDNPHPIVSRWLKERRVFAVDSPQGRLIPAFQLDENGEPRPAIAQVLAALSGELRDWEILLWFTGSSGHLGGARPADLLDSKPDAVIAAAAYQASLSED